MALEPAVLGYTKSEVTGVSDRVYALKAPQGATKPYIVFRIVSSNFVHSMPDDSGLTESRVQFDVFADGYAVVKGITESLKSTYRNYTQGTDVAAQHMSGEEWVQATLLANETDQYEDDTGVYHTAIDVMFWHHS